MRCLVTGAYGFIGRELVAALQSEGVRVVGAGRDLALGRRILPHIEWIACDFNRDVEVANWLPRLAGIDAVVNSVGILQSSLHDAAERIHGQATIALFEACAASGVRRLVHISAVSADSDLGTTYARSKAAADRALAGLDINWLIVKPSLVIGRGSYGGTSLLRGVAGLPWLLPLPGPATERFQPIALDDLARGIARLTVSGEPARTTLHAAGLEALSVRDILVAYRAWLGFPEARAIVVPRPCFARCFVSAMPQVCSAFLLRFEPPRSHRCGMTRWLMAPRSRRQAVCRSRASKRRCKPRRRPCRTACMREAFSSCRCCR